MSGSTVPTCAMQPSGPYPKPLGPESQPESSNPIVAHVGGLGGGAGSTVPLKYRQASPTTIGSGGLADASHAPLVGLQVWPTGQPTGTPEQVPPEQASPVVQR